MISVIYSDTMNLKFKESKNCSKECHYLDNFINKTFHDEFPQGPTCLINNSKCMPFVMAF